MLLSLCGAVGLSALAYKLCPAAGSGGNFHILLLTSSTLPALAPFLWVTFAGAYIGRRGSLTGGRTVLLLGMLLLAQLLLLAYQLPASATTAALSAGDLLLQMGGLWPWGRASLIILAMLLGSFPIYQHALTLRPAHQTLAKLSSLVAVVPPIGDAVLLGVELTHALPPITPLLYAAAALLLWSALRQIRHTAAPARPDSPPFWSLGHSTSPQHDALAVMSHEMRGRLSGIVGAADLLNLTALDERQRDLLDLVRRSGQDLIGVIGNTLDLAASDTSRLAAARAPFELSAVVESALDAVTAEATRKQIQLCYAIEDATPNQLIGDGPRLTQVLLNLVGNSVKFTEHGGVLVSVSSRAAHGRLELRVTVSDTGSGIPEGQRERLFEPFSTAQRGAPTGAGSGLGLTISRRLALLMGGDLRLQCSSSAGTTFAFTVVVDASPAAAAAPTSAPQFQQKRLLLLGAPSPARAVVAATAQRWGMDVASAGTATEALGWLEGGRGFDAALVIQQGSPDGGLMLSHLLRLTGEREALPTGLVTWRNNEEAARLGEDGAYQETIFYPLRHAALRSALLTLVGASPRAEADAPIAPLPASSAGPALSTLVVDDHDLSRELALQMLRALGHVVEGAADAETALRLVRSRHYDVLLLDLNLAGQYGLDLAERIRAELGPEQQPCIIALTGDDSVRDDPRAQAAIGAWCVKPLTLSALGAALSECAALPMQAPARPTAWDGLRPASHGPLDSSLTEFMEHFGIDIGQAQSFVDQYLADTALLVREMRSSLRDSDTRRIAQAAHKLKSSSAIFCEHDLARLCHELDLLAVSSDPASVDRYVHMIEAEYERVRARSATTAP